jgi:hypothetical protein
MGNGKGQGPGLTLAVMRDLRDVRAVPDAEDLDASGTGVLAGPALAWR